MDGTGDHHVKMHKSVLQTQKSHFSFICGIWGEDVNVKKNCWGREQEGEEE
jgi:hypothetical protein